MLKPNTSLVIAVAGGSGSGKTTFARMMRASFGEDLCSILSQDSYYFDLSQQRERSELREVNYDHPSSIEFDLMKLHLSQLKLGQSIEVPFYDLKTHQRVFSQEILQPKPVVLVDGILILTQPELRDLFDFIFFIDTQEELRFKRRLQRDVAERGRTPEGVYHQFFSQVKPMHDEFVEPSRILADRILPGDRSFTPLINEFIFGLKSSSLSL